MPLEEYHSDKVQLEADIGASLGESPAWSAAGSKLLSVDINNKKIHIFDPADKSLTTVSLDEAIGAVIPTSQPHILVAALERDVVTLDISNPAKPVKTVLATTPEDHGLPSEGWRFNDAKAAPGNTLILGRMHKDWRNGTNGRVYSLTKDGQLQQIVQQNDVNLPNGMAWDEKKRVMYFADTGANTIFSYPTDEAGVPLPDAHREVAVQLLGSGTDGPPDGITIDSDGNIWAALAESGRVACFSPAGEELRSVELPVKRPTALTFGGNNLEQLFITTRVESGDSPSEHAGGLFSTTIPGVRGAAAAYTFDA